MTDSARARAAESNRRRAEARRRALMILSRRYSKEFRILQREARRDVDAERGPLPGEA